MQARFFAPSLWIIQPLGHKSVFTANQAKPKRSHFLHAGQINTWILRLRNDDNMMEECGV